MITISGDLFYTYSAPTTGLYEFNTCGSTFDTQLQVTRLTALPGTCTGTCLGHNDNALCSGSPSLQSSLVVSLTAGDTVLLQAGGCGPLDIGTIVLSGGPVSGLTIKCDPASPHFGGLYTKLNASFMGSGVGSDLHLDATDGAPDQFGFFLVSSSATSVLPVFNGVLCLDAPIGRYNATSAAAPLCPNPAINSIGQFDSTGSVFMNLSGTSTILCGGAPCGFDVPAALPLTPCGQMIMPGDTWCFQLWHRDFDPGGMPSANFSNVLGVNF